MWWVRLRDLARNHRCSGWKESPKLSCPKIPSPKSTGIAVTFMKIIDSLRSTPDLMNLTIWHWAWQYVFFQKVLQETVVNVWVWKLLISLNHLDAWIPFGTYGPSDAWILLVSRNSLCHSWKSLCLLFSVDAFCSVNCRWLILWCKIANAPCLYCKSSSPSKCLEFDWWYPSHCHGQGYTWYLDS